MRGDFRICAFEAKRVMPEAEPPHVAKTIVNGAWREERVTPKAPPVGRCEHESSRGRCAKPGAGYAAYVWGSVALCTKHLDEECPERSNDHA